ncbi:unnamed protein product [Cuscuta europaea]|uniref:Uncharacterized protein n=1 Tax=Cuscuta europaea TaxID=41803 RepID=A0A9P0ZGN7_CUSEU|nr:unnamed protein product [Cuscuta europaea]
MRLLCLSASQLKLHNVVLTEVEKDSRELNALFVAHVLRTQSMSSASNDGEGPSISSGTARSSSGLLDFEKCLDTKLADFEEFVQGKFNVLEQKLELSVFITF